MNLRVIKGGVMDTIQDLGRYGYQHLGINPSGAMDKFSVRVANILAGNKQDEAIIELHFPAGEYFFEQTALIAITGADFVPLINGDPVPVNHPILVNKFSVLHFEKIRSGSRAYLAINGGFAIDKWLDSYSTNLKAQAGGFNGRALLKDDDIPLRNNNTNTQTEEYTVLRFYADYKDSINDTNEIFVIKGREWNEFDFEMQRAFLSSKFLVTPQSDRMGYRLSTKDEGRSTKDEGRSTKDEVRSEVISSGVCFGTVQVLPDNQLIVLMADHQTTGGYPRIAHVISAHHSLLSQKRAGEYLKFKLVSLEEAKMLQEEQEDYLSKLEYACKLKGYAY
jgi:antagonist of KipI